MNKSILLFSSLCIATIAFGQDATAVVNTVAADAVASTNKAVSVVNNATSKAQGYFGSAANAVRSAANTVKDSASSALTKTSSVVKKGASVVSNGASSATKNLKVSAANSMSWMKQHPKTTAMAVVTTLVIASLIYVALAQSDEDIENAEFKTTEHEVVDAKAANRKK